MVIYMKDMNVMMLQDSKLEADRKTLMYLHVKANGL
jgi:hypothetical protein